MTQRRRKSRKPRKNSGWRMVRAGRNAKEIIIPTMGVSGLSDYTCNVVYKSGSINYTFGTKTFIFGRETRLMVDVMDVGEAGIHDEQPT